MEEYHKLEFLALKWAVCKQFHDYLYGHKFEVKTDNNPLTYILSTAKLDAAGHRWLADLATYDFSITYQSGKKNRHADGLSRMPHTKQVHEDNYEMRKLDSSSIGAISASYLTDSPEAAVETLCMTSAVITDSLLSPGSRMMDRNMLEKAQVEDTLTAMIIKCLKEDRKPSDREKQDPAVQQVLHGWARFHVKDGLLYRERIVNEETRYQLFLPKSLVDMVFTGLHNNMGHFGLKRNLDLIQERF